mgnify:CR=1 FL=1
MARKKQQPKRESAVKMQGFIAGAGEIVEQDINDTIRKNFMPYAMSVILSRAIPEIDGFKPSHRKLLYTMYKMNLLGSARTKSANIVGQTMKLNPHGDAAIYDTMVRLSRGYEALLHPYVDSKGNFGKFYSRDMAWAASRYTEARLDGICRELFRDIDKDTVDFIDNYDSTTKEPTLLPAAFPSVLVNANTGIAVGMASSICPFNLAEVCNTAIELMKNPKHDLFTTMQAPDFPGGGQIIFDRKAMEQIYETGRGSIRVRARYTFDKAANCIDITQIPPTTTIEAIVEKVIDLVKQGKLKELTDIRDETGLDGLKITIDLKRGTDPEKLMQRLFKMTSLEDSFACNFNVLIAGTPKVLGVRQILEEWTAWRTGSVRRRVYFVMKKKQDKLHLLKGLKRILLDIDKAIQIIRETEEEAEVIPNLMIGFGIDQIQAEYVAEIKLRNINKEYILKRVNETDALQDEIADLEDTLNSPRRLKQILVDELTEAARKYGEPRRTSIVYSHEIETYVEEAQVEDYSVHVFLSREGYFKKIPPASLRMAADQKYKDGDGLSQTFETTNGAEIMFFTDRCQVYKTRLSEFEDTKASALGDYLPAKLSMDSGENVIYAVLPGPDYAGALLFFFANGKAARVDLTAYKTTSNRRKLTGAYSDKAPLACIRRLDTDCELAVYSTEPRALIFHTALLAPKTTRTTQGVAVMTLKPKYQLETVKALEDTPITNQSRYRVRSLPAAGALLREEDSEERQMDLLD